MMNRFLLFFCCLVITSPFPAMADGGLPRDLLAFITQRDRCDHFRGEEPYDTARRKFLIEQVNKNCRGTDQALHTLQQKYAQDPDLLQYLNKYEQNIE